MTAQQLIQHLQLQAHPEGGFFKEVYRSGATIGKECLPPVFTGERQYCTSIYYLLQKGDYSTFHRIKSDEIWHFYSGGLLFLHLLQQGIGYKCLKLGTAVADGANFQLLVPAGVWFAAEPAPGTAFTLAGCTVSPGFDFRDFEMANKEAMMLQFPEHQEIINRLCRQG